MNHEIPDIQAGFGKGRGTRDQIDNIRWIIKKAREFQKNIYFHFVYYAKVFRRHLMGTSPGWIQGYPQDDGIGDWKDR